MTPMTTNSVEAPGAVGPDTTVAEALATLTANGARATIVEDAGRPLGVITIDVLQGRPGQRPHPEAKLIDVMEWECVRRDPGADAAATLHTFTGAAWDSLRRRHAR